MEKNFIQGFPTPQIGFYKVYVRTITYNQATYIEDCLNGVAAQKTTFPFVHFLIDDFSSDGEQNVIKSWMDKECNMDDAEYYDNDICTIIHAKNNKNSNNTIVAYFLKRNLYKDNNRKEELYAKWRAVCPYEALCEGDDYWIDPLKLQKQVNYMELHPECSYLFTDRYIDHENSGIRQEIRYQKNEYSTHDILSGFIPGLQTVMFRRELLGNPIMQTKGINGDRLYSYAASTMGEVHCLHDITAVYRNTGKGVSTSVNQNVFFEHVVNDFMRFHKNLGVNDWMAYLNGQSHKLGTYGPGLTRWKRFCGAYYEYHKIDPRIGLFSYILMIVLFLKKQIYSRLNIYDPKRYNLKAN